MRLWRAWLIVLDRYVAFSQKPPAKLEGERSPLVLVVPENYGAENDQGKKKSEIGLLPEQPFAVRAIRNKKEQRRGNEEQRRILRKHSEAQSGARAVPCGWPVLKDRDRDQVNSEKPEADQWNVRGDDHAVNKIERNHLKQERRPKARSTAKPQPPQSVDEPSRNDNQPQAADSYPNLGFPQQQRACSNHPGHHRWMIQVAQIRVNRIIPVVGLLGREIDRCGRDEAQK